jgi:hypothetical protein
MLLSVVVSIAAPRFFNCLEDEGDRVKALKGSGVLITAVLQVFGSADYRKDTLAMFARGRQIRQ